MAIFLSDRARLFHADCRETLRSLLDNSVDSVVTDPPYELNFMGKGWDDTGIANDPALWREAFRVLKPGAHLAAFSASRTYHRMACAIEDAGFEIRDSLMWIYGTGFPKGLNVSKQIDNTLGAERKVIGYDAAKAAQQTAKQGTSSYGDYEGNSGAITEPVTPQAIEFDGFSTALKPAFEPIVLARKPLSESTVAKNVLKWRTGALNIGACRVPAETREAKAGGMARKANPVYGSFAGVEDVSGTTTEGRWPANVVTDGSAEVVGMFPHTHGAGAAGYNKKREDYDAANMKFTNGNMFRIGDAGGSAARFFYSAKASKADRNGSKHPTVKPIALMEWLAALITPPGGTILDPFAGSGTTGIAATRKGFNVILCEREAEYVADICARFVGIAPPAWPWS